MPSQASINEPATIAGQSQSRTLPVGRGDLPDLDRVRRLLLWPRQAEAAALLSTAARRLGGEAETLEGAVLSLRLSGAAAFCEAAGALMSTPEQAETRALALTDASIVPTMTDYGDMTTMAELSCLARAAWLVDLLAEGRYASWFHPIVQSIDGSVFGHEMLLRGFEPSGGIIPPVRIFEAAESEAVMAALENAARTGAMRADLIAGIPPDDLAVAQSVMDRIAANIARLERQ